LKLAGDAGAVDKKVDPVEFLKNTRDASRDPARIRKIRFRNWPAELDAGPQTPFINSEILSLSVSAIASTLRKQTFLVPCSMPLI
jgi:hypothetical protein